MRTTRIILGTTALLIALVVLGLRVLGPPGSPRRPAEPEGTNARRVPGDPTRDDPPEDAVPTGAVDVVVESAITAKPIDGALVELTAEGAIGPVGARTPLLATGRTAVNGSVRIDTAPALRILQITASARGFHPAGRRLVLVPGRPIPILHIRLDPGGVLSGSVFDPDGRPIDGARVSVVPAQMRYQFDSRTGIRDDGHYPPTAVTGEDGSYEVTGIPLGGHYHVIAVKRPWALTAAYDGVGVYFDDREPVRRLDLTMRRRGTVVVHVFGPGGSPVVGANVTVGYDFLGWGMTASVDGPGIYRFGGAHPKELPVHVLGPPFAVAKTTVEVPEGGTAHVSVHLEHGLTIEGTVVNDRGQPIAGARLRAQRPPYRGGSGNLVGIGGPGTDEGPSEMVTETDERGRFVLAGLRKGGHELKVGAPGHCGRHLNAPEVPHRGLRIVLSRSATIRFRLEPPLPEVRARWRGVRAPRGWMWAGSTTREEVLTPSEDGVFEIRDCGLGDRELMLDPRDSVVVPHLLNLEAGETTDLGVISLDEGVVLVGRVIGQAGVPLPGATVRVPTGWRGAAHITHTDLDGRFRIPHLPEHHVSVQASYPGYDSAEVVAEGGVVITLQRPRMGRFILRVTDSRGTSVRGERVRVHYPDGEGGFKPNVWREEYTSSTGRIEWMSEPGRFLARLAKHPDVSVVVEVKRGETTHAGLTWPD